MTWRSFGLFSISLSLGKWSISKHRSRLLCPRSLDHRAQARWFVRSDVWRASRPPIGPAGCRRYKVEPNSVTFNRRQRTFSCFQQGFGAHRVASGMLHPEIRSNVSHLCHALELGTNRSRFLHLLFNLKRNQVSDGIVRQVEKRVDHVRVNTQ